MSKKQPAPAHQLLSLDSDPANLARWESYPPHSPKKFKRRFYSNRKHRKELIACGALIRLDGRLWVNMPAYLAWFRSHVEAVEDYEMPCNSAEHIHKRFGGRDADRDPQPA